jgi:hypothetical protein
MSDNRGFQRYRDNLERQKKVERERRNMPRISQKGGKSAITGAITRPDNVVFEK